MLEMICTETKRKLWNRNFKKNSPTIWEPEDLIRDFFFFSSHGYELKHGPSVDACS